MCSLRNQSARVPASAFSANAARPRNSGAVPKLRQAANQRNRAPAGRDGESCLGEGKQDNIWRNAMDIKQGRTAGTRPASIIGLGCIAAILAAAPASANTACSLPAVYSLGLAGLTITAATDHPATATRPEYCQLRGAEATDGLCARPGTATIHARLPAASTRQ